MNRIRFRQRTSTRSISRQRVVAFAAAGAILAIGLVIIFNLAGRKDAMAAANGDYRSAATGNWNNLATWERFNGTTWLPAIATPTSTDGVITIRSGFPVTI